MNSSSVQVSQQTLIAIVSCHRERRLSYYQKPFTLQRTNSKSITKILCENKLYSFSVTNSEFSAHIITFLTAINVPEWQWNETKNLFETVRPKTSMNAMKRKTAITLKQSSFLKRSIWQARTRWGRGGGRGFGRTTLEICKGFLATDLKMTLGIGHGLINLPKKNFREKITGSPFFSQSQTFLCLVPLYSSNVLAMSNWWPRPWLRLQMYALVH